MAKKIPINTQELAVKVLHKVDGMREDGKHCDFLIKVGSEEIPAHRNILSATSDYFDAMFRHPTEENKSGVVVMMGVDPGCAVICVDHMYGKEVSILPGKSQPLMYVATLMQLHTLRDAIATLLEANLDLKSFTATKKIADMYGCKKLEEKCNEFAEENFGLLSKEEEFAELDKSFINKMIKSKNVKISEEEKLDALLIWSKFDSGRNKFLEDMIEVIDLSKVSLGFRRNVAENEPLVSENFRLYKMISASVFNTVKIVSKRIPSRTDADDGYSAVAIFDKNSDHVYHWNPRENTWKRMQEMNDEMKSDRFSAVELGGYLYVLMASKSFYRLKYSDETSRWDQMPNMLESHGLCPPATVLDGYIYVIGGHSLLGTRLAEKYCPAENTWISISSINQTSQGSEVIASQGFIRSFGGYVGRKYAKQHTRFDPSDQTWAEMLPMKEDKGFAASATCGGKIYVLGGYTGVMKRTVEVFDAEVNQWETLEPMLVGRYWFRAFGIDRCIYAVGGLGSANSIEMYDVEKNERKMVEIPTGMKLDIVESVKIQISP